MAAEDCLAEIAKVLGRPLSQTELDEMEPIFDELIRVQKSPEYRLGQAEEKLAKAAEDLIGRARQAALHQERGRLINILRYNDLMGFATRVDAATGDPSLALSAKMVGINARVPGARKSVDAMSNALVGEWLGGMVADLERANLFPQLNSRMLEPQIAAEMWQLSLGENGKPGMTGSKDALEIARIFRKYQDASLDRENRAGAWIQRIQGYVFRQSHDMAKLRRASYEEWRDFIMPLLDDERTFGRQQERRDSLNGMMSDEAERFRLIGKGVDEADTELKKLQGDRGKAQTRLETADRQLERAQSEVKTLETQQDRLAKRAETLKTEARRTEAAANAERTAKQLEAAQERVARAEEARVKEREALEAMDDTLGGKQGEIAQLKFDRRQAELEMAKIGKAIDVTQGAVSDADAFLKHAYDNLASGVHLKANGADESDLNLAFKGPGNLAKKLSAHRVLHFKSSDDFLKYNARFGHGSLVDSIFRDLERGARNTAMMETFGPNPRAMFDRVREDLMDKYRGDYKKIDRLRPGVLDRLSNQFSDISGETRIAGNVNAAVVVAGVQAVESMAKLGGAVLSSFGDLATKMQALREGGDNAFAAWGRSFSSSVEGMAPGELKVTSELLGVGLDGMIGSILSRFTVMDDTPGAITNAMQKFFKFSLLTPWTEGHKTGLALMWSRDLAMQKGKGFAQLDPAMRRLMGYYGIDEARWDVARRAVRTEADGREYLMPDAIRDLPDQAFHPLIAGPVNERSIARTRDEMETALRTYFMERADAAVPTPGARERAFLTQGTRPGTVVGTAARIIGQFKAFPVTVVTKVLGRMAGADTHAQFFRNMIAGEGDFLGLVNLIAGMAVLGYASQSAKEVAKGRSPRDPSDYKTWLAALLQGGGLGIYGDFLLGETNRNGRSMLDTLAGPTLGTIADIDQIRAKWMAGEDAGGDVIRLIKSNTPFMNLFYTQAAMDYLLVYQLQEMANPGYLSRMEQRIRKENNQTFLLPPSQAVPYGGGSRLFEGVR
jgi:hypothetical protein